MKKFLLSLAAIALVATPVQAHKEHKERDVKTEEVIAALILAGLIGAAIADRRESEEVESYEDRYDHISRRNKYRDQQYRCRDHMEVSYRNGRRITYNVRRCN